MKTNGTKNIREAVRGRSLLRVVLGTLVLCTGCWSSSEREVVVYCALDSEFAEPILRQSESNLHLTVRAKYDVEASKTVGLAQALIAERERPRCDVFWDNEILHMVRLEQAGLLEKYTPPNAAAYPAEFKSRNGTWYGFAARARVLLVNKDLVAATDMPASIRDLAAKNWGGRVAIANPLFGTTATHAACLWATWGEAETKAYFLALRENGVKVLPGNKQVARAVSAGQIAFGLTDTDDAIVEVEAGRPVKIVYPDQGEQGLGTLFIPNTIAVMKRGPHPEAAQQLVNYALSAEVESKLAVGESAQIPLNPAVKANSRVALTDDIRWMRVDYGQGADAWEATAQFLRQEFVK